MQSFVGREREGGGAVGFRIGGFGLLEDFVCALGFVGFCSFSVFVGGFVSELLVVFFVLLDWVLVFWGCCCCSCCCKERD